MSKRKRYLIGGDAGYLVVRTYNGDPKLETFSADFEISGDGDATNIGDVCGFDRDQPIRGLEDAKEVYVLLGEWIAEVEAAARVWAGGEGAITK